MATAKARKPSKRTTQRRGLLAQVHMAKKDLRLDDELYRDIIEELCGVRSSGDLSVSQLITLRDHLRERGWAGGGRQSAPERQPKRRGPNKAKGKGDNFVFIPTSDPNWLQKRHLAALWVRLGYHVKDLDVRCQREFGVESFLWLRNQDQLQDLGRDIYARCRKFGIDPEA